ncbi:MAG: putative cytosolic protein [Synergistales bacterium 54_9]|nr:MAG: putative cytosolic protein [Synergistales bacterium 54_9]
MGRSIRIVSKGVVVEGKLNDSKTASEIEKLIPLVGRARTWGDEIYFPIPLDREIENGKETVEKVDIGYWPPGRALCLFFGPTPMSAPGEIRPAGPVTVVGRMEGDLSILKKISEGDDVKVEALG